MSGMSARTTIDDDGDLCLELSTDDTRIGFVVSTDSERAGWYYASQRDGWQRGGSGKLSQEDVANIRTWLERAGCQGGSGGGAG